MNHRPVDYAPDNRIIAGMRVVLALSGLLILLLDRSTPPYPLSLAPLVLALYALYGLVVYLLTVAGRGAQGWINRWSHWIDVAWYLLLIASSQGTNSIFFFGFFFAILVASFQHGFAEGLTVSVVSALLFSLVGLATSPAGNEFELDRFLIRPVFLLVLGFMVAHWGGYETSLKRRLALLREVTAISNPRFGIDRTISSIMSRVRAFYDADTCVAVTGDADGDRFQLRVSRATGVEGESGPRAAPIPAPLGRALLSLPAERNVVYSPVGVANGRFQPGPDYIARDPVSGTVSDKGHEQAAAVAATLEARAFISTPLNLGGDLSGRLYVTSSGRRSFTESDADFLYQVVEQVTPVIDNIRLVDRLASDAAEAERQRIARDLHDSIIQPYIGLQIGLGALLRKHESGQEINGEIARLLDLTDSGITDLRGYVRGLKQPGDQHGTLLPAVQRFARKFSEATGIQVEVDAAGPLRLSDRLAAEAFQIVAEGLSNIRRHTPAGYARIRLTQQDGSLVVRIENPRDLQVEASLFAPRSISERASALGGSARVEQCPDGMTVVEVQVPL